MATKVEACFLLLLSKTDITLVDIIKRIGSTSRNANASAKVS